MKSAAEERERQGRGGGERGGVAWGKERKEGRKEERETLLFSTHNPIVHASPLSLSLCRGGFLKLREKWGNFPPREKSGGRRKKKRRRRKKNRTHTHFRYPEILPKKKVEKIHSFSPPKTRMRKDMQRLEKQDQSFF